MDLLPVSVNGLGILACPVDGEEYGYLHQESTTVDSGGDVRIQFYGENDEGKFVLVIRQHKGNTVLEWVRP
jgi:hypothetical protein